MTNTNDRFLTFVECLQLAQDLWKFAMPEVSFPPNMTWSRWLNSATDKEMEYAILLVPPEFRSVIPDAEDVYRFISSSLSSQRARRAKSASQWTMTLAKEGLKQVKTEESNPSGGDREC